MTDLHSLLDLPASVSKSAFVVQLAAGVQNPGSVLDNYAITPDLVRAFDQALQLVHTSIDSRRSSASYVHGSFGSGKSHFLSVLSLMLSPEPEHQTKVWRDDELASLRAKHRWLESKKLLRLHFNMVNASSLEERVFTEYVRQVRERHPDSPLPALFLDAALFDNARQLRARLGDDAFFAPLNEGRPVKAGWGARGASAQWTPERFERAVETDVLEERAALYTVLVKSHFTAWQNNNHAFVPFDRGLAELSRHARALGYDAVILFFDELVLWLAGGAADRKWLNTEIQKLAKIVDSDDADRPLALVSFVARQRDISELVGDQWAGSDAHALRDSLKWWEGRFNTITLPDRNLPAIVRKRVVRPKDEDARKRLDAAFAELRRKLGPQAWQTLLGDIGDGEEAFAKVYPFSPALVEVLVAMSATLQRERTALRLLMEVLVRHLDDFELGKVVAVGDLFDPLAGGEDPMDGVMRERFQSARRLYQNELLPVIQQENRTGTPEKCQRLRESHAPELGCSNCREARCRTDNRLVKTLLLAALVPNSPVLRNLTITRLVALNHGTLRSPIPNNEGNLATERLRKYAGQVGKLRVGEGQKDPSVSVVLEGVDLKPILDSARQYDMPGARKSKLRELLFTAFDFSRSDVAEYDMHVEWRGTQRDGSVYFGNVREMEESRFRVKPGQAFRVVIDYPFDEPGRTPQEDETRLEELKEKLEECTVVWLPDFFSEALQQELGQLVIIGEILKGEAWKDYLKHLRAEDQLRTKSELESLQSQKMQRVAAAIRSAYNISAEAPDQLDPARKVSEHFHVLMSQRRVSNLSVTDLRGSIEALARAVLAECFPWHPEFNQKVTAPLLSSALRRFAALCEREGRRDLADAKDKRELDVPQRLGFVQATESNVSVRDEEFAAIDRALSSAQAHQQREVSVGAVRRVIDPKHLRGLTPEVDDFIVLAYAAYSGREVRAGTRVIDEPKFGQLSDDAVLVTAELPRPDAWERAIHRAGAFFGVAIGSRALRSKHVAKLAVEVIAAVKRARDNVAALPQLLELRRSLGATSGDRAATADEARRLLDELARAERQGSVAVVDALANFESGRPDAAVARAIESASDARSVLTSNLLWSSIESMHEHSDSEDQSERAAAQRAVVELAQKLLRSDEHVLSLKQNERALNAQVEALMAGAKRPAPRAEPAAKEQGFNLLPTVGITAVATKPSSASRKPDVVKSGEARGGAVRDEIERIREALASLELADGEAGEWVLRWSIERG